MVAVASTCSVASHEALKSSPAWSSLPVHGYQGAMVPGKQLELRTCTCGSTLAIEVDAPEPMVWMVVDEDWHSSLLIECRWPDEEGTTHTSILTVETCCDRHTKLIVRRGPALDEVTEDELRDDIVAWQSEGARKTTYFDKRGDQPWSKAREIIAALEIERCTGCGAPAHATETDDEGRCATCALTDAEIESLLERSIAREDLELVDLCETALKTIIQPSLKRAARERIAAILNERNGAAKSSACPCGCCVERRDMTTHGRPDPGCHCNAHPEQERCECAGCTTGAAAVRS